MLVEEVGSSGVGSLRKVSLSEKVVLALLVVQAGAVGDGSGFLLSRQVIGYTDNEAIGYLGL